MIIYNNYRWYGHGLLFHITGSGLFNIYTLPKAFLSGLLSVFAVFHGGLHESIQSNFIHPEAFFSLFAFLVTFLVVYRSNLAVQRYSYANESYANMTANLFDLASLVSSFILKQDPKSNFVRSTIFRYVRLYHKLSLGRFLGKSMADISDKKNDCLCLPDEFEILTQTRNKPPQVLYWIESAVTRNRELFNVEPPVLSKIFSLASAANQCFYKCVILAESPFPFAFAQVAFLAINLWAVVVPFLAAAYIPNSAGLAFFLTFISTWVLFAANECASTMENPFDGTTNGLPLHYYERVFASDMDGLEFGEIPVALQTNLHVCADIEMPNEDASTPRQESAALKENGFSSPVTGLDRSSSIDLPEPVSAHRASLKIIQERFLKPKESKNDGDEHKCIYATENLPVDQFQVAHNLFAKCGLKHMHKTTIDILLDPYGNPVIVRSGRNTAFAHLQ
mmetsp:Transcript_18080/g.23632  ORF Transcript_18080/g.23632 Transcript_18080/m.23632 type:complete len:450 (-) Transcript_18080:1662-3011(-)